MKTYISIFISASILLFSSAAIADDCKQAAYFYEKGQYRSARTILDPLVKKGEACAEYYMGLIYEKSKKTRNKGVKLIESASAKGYLAAIKFMNSYH